MNNFFIENCRIFFRKSGISRKKLDRIVFEGRNNFLGVGARFITKVAITFFVTNGLQNIFLLSCLFGKKKLYFPRKFRKLVKSQGAKSGEYGMYFSIGVPLAAK